MPEVPHPLACFGIASTPTLRLEVATSNPEFLTYVMDDQMVAWIHDELARGLARFEWGLRIGIRMA